jgi:hypothetical protein
LKGRCFNGLLEIAARCESLPLFEYGSRETLVKRKTADCKSFVRGLRACLERCLREQAVDDFIRQLAHEKMQQSKQQNLHERCRREECSAGKAVESWGARKAEVR